MQPSASTLQSPTSDDDPVVLFAVSVMDFDAFYRSEYAAMRALARNICGDSATAEDLVQEAFTRAHQQWQTIGAYDRPGAWLRRVTINLALSRRRRIGRELHAMRRKALERPAVVEHEIDDEVWEAVRRLPRRQRAVVALFYQEDRSTREIAEILGCTISTATSHLNQARKKLAADLGEQAPPKGQGEGEGDT